MTGLVLFLGGLILGEFLGVFTAALMVAVHEDSDDEQS